ncbi:MAG TPA: deoxyribodipyrimidine photo-lyase [Cyclobacteriaceae bacterium]|nr:deoxyribodipyrimidine photo-lyase [Cyclobacteriaceae bacterium]
MNLSKTVTSDVTLFWLRRDLRLTDNAGLYHALKEKGNVLCVFIFDSHILDKLEDEDDRRVTFIYQSLTLLKNDLERHGSSLLVVHSTPEQFFTSVSPKAVYTNHDYEPYARKRDELVADILAKKQVEFKSFKDQVIFEKGEVLKDDGSPYTVFTPYSKKWKAALKPFYYKTYPTEKYFVNLIKTDPLAMPSLDEIGFKKVTDSFPERVIKSEVIKQYHKQRDYPGIEGTSKLSVHLRFGTVSIRQLVTIALKKNEVWLNELIWREFYHMILWHFPKVEQAFKPAYDLIEWRNDKDEFEAWCKGETGYPIVDAGMRELNQTGFMHNRVRMIVASFLTKHLLIDWRWGEAYFARKLLDFDLAANNGGWQWAAGSGCDAAPYFRVFNPYLQTEKFDPERTYIKRWVPEVDTPDYPKPIVDHAFARERVLSVYKVALES